MNLNGLTAEGGPIEGLQIVLLVGASATLLLAAVRGRPAGAALLTLMAGLIAVAALREYETEAVGGVTAYAASRLARWHVAGLVGFIAAGLMLRGLAIPWRDHWAEVRGAAPLMLGGVLMLGLGGVVENISPDAPVLRLAYTLAEEGLELIAYAIVAGSAALVLHRRNRLRTARFGHG